MTFEVIGSSGDSVCPVVEPEGVLDGDGGWVATPVGVPRKVKMCLGLGPPFSGLSSLATRRRGKSVRMSWRRLDAGIKKVGSGTLLDERMRIGVDKTTRSAGNKIGSL